MHYADITDKAIAQRLIIPSGNTPHDTMGAQLAVDVKKGTRSRFVRTKPAHYDLNPYYKPTQTKPRASRRSKPKHSLKETTAKTSPKMPSSYTGKGGEHLVASKLLFLGYNVSIMAVDTGADLIATKGGQTFYIQVKTANLSGNRYQFNIRTSSFEKHASGRVFYIFVIRHGNSSNDPNCEDFLILPYSKIQEYISKNLIRYIHNNSLLSVSVMKDENGFSLSPRGNDVGFYTNNWSLIK